MRSRVRLRPKISGERASRSSSTIDSFGYPRASAPRRTGCINRLVPHSFCVVKPAIAGPRVAANARPLAPAPRNYIGGPFDSPCTRVSSRKKTARAGSSSIKVAAVAGQEFQAFGRPRGAVGISPRCGNSRILIRPIPRLRLLAHLLAQPAASPHAAS
jgi:hypothetical protein